MNSIKLFNWDGTNDFNPEKQYEWRLKWLDETIKKREKRGEVFPNSQKEKWKREEDQMYNNQKRDFEKIQKLQKEIAIIIPTHFYQRIWLKKCLESCQKTGYFTLVCYDNPFHNINQQVQDRMPSATTIMLADSFIMKPKTWSSGVGVPHSWNMFFGANFLQSLGFKYIFNLNGDCIMEKPEGLEEIIKMLGDNDAISCEFEEGRYFGTMSYLIKLEPAVRMWNENFARIFQYNFGNAEARMGIFAKKLELKVVPVENPEDHHFKPPGVKGTWRHILGFRHLHAEHKHRKKFKMEPLEEKYFEVGKNYEFLNQHEINTLVKYWETNDKSYLEKWWNS